jgi:hypothetical protein
MGQPRPKTATQKIPRRPPQAVRDELCAEVGFRCPVQDCGSPYLSFHHFNPPWRTKPHHDPSGMIALCLNHAGKADNGSYPNDYLSSLKREGVGLAQTVEGEFDYLRRDVIAVLGSGIYYETRTLLEINGERCIYFNRDKNGYLLLNLKLPTAAGEPRALMVDNVWVVPPGAGKIVCPPRGRSLRVEFDNGDFFRIEFTDVESPVALKEKYPWTNVDALADEVTFPIAVVEFWERSSNSAIEIGRHATTLPGRNLIANIVSIRNGVGISVRVPASDLFGSKSPPSTKSDRGQTRAAASALTAQEMIVKALNDYNRGR